MPLLGDSLQCLSSVLSSPNSDLLESSNAGLCPFTKVRLGAPPLGGPSSTPRLFLLIACLFISTCWSIKVWSNSWVLATAWIVLSNLLWYISSPCTLGVLMILALLTLFSIFRTFSASAILSTSRPEFSEFLSVIGSPQYPPTRCARLN